MSVLRSYYDEGRVRNLDVWVCSPPPLLLAGSWREGRRASQELNQKSGSISSPCGRLTKARPDASLAHERKPTRGVVGVASRCVGEGRVQRQAASLPSWMMILYFMRGE